MRALGVVVPAYRPDVDCLLKYVATLDERLAPTAIRIELDVPREGVRRVLERSPATVGVAPRRRGKGAAIAAGFDRFRANPDIDADALAFFDADASTPVDSALAVVEPVLDGAADLAVGSRRHPDATIVRHQTHGRRRLGEAFAWLARQSVEPSLYDYQCGAKAIGMGTWAAVREHVAERGFGWDVELLVIVAALGCEIQEVPVVWHDRPESTVPPLATAAELALGLARARRRAGRLDSDARASEHRTNCPETQSEGREPERRRRRKRRECDRNASR